MKVVIITYGCQMNVHDSEVIKKSLKDMGLEISDDVEGADIIILNTCCVRESAEKRIYGRINYLKKQKYNKPQLIIGMIGCLAQKDKGTVFKKAPHVDFALGPQEIDRIPEMIRKTLMGQKMIGEFGEHEFIGEIDQVLPDNQWAGWLSIMKGCDNYCSYCIVPYVRGHEKSKKYSLVEQEFRYLESIGVKDVTLLGQNVNSYGKGLQEKIDFADLLTRLDRLDLIHRIRFMTSHPKDLSEKVIYAIAQGKNLCEHVHLPFQAGSDRILESMNRKYRIDDYLEKVSLIKSEIKGCALTTDIIVGFPGETEDDFQKTLDVVRNVGFDSVHTFIYSIRSGTRAAEFGDQVPEDVKKERIARLIDIQNSISLEKNRALEGQVFDVLFDNVDKNGKRLQGRTRSNKIVVTDMNRDLLGREVKVRILEGLHWTLVGEVLHDD
ncbi:MAG: tRNA (N6-isopentenyl adenosine(37)-C2)-methylthiotransferase MiaB [Candidatus Muiribacteriaceae bacterium]